MEDLTNWVTREAQNMGVDFSCLNPQTRNQIISILMSGLENGFRSRMDSPDLRFAKRRGIGKGNQKNISAQASRASTNDSDKYAPDTGGLSIDNGCTNERGHDCSDHSISGCQDISCTNNNNCTDFYPCEDSRCKNTYNCTDSGGTSQLEVCLDINCSNLPDNSGGLCSDGGPSSGCKDNPCHNDSKCSDSGSLGQSVTIYCIDGQCLNSGTVAQGPSCTDLICKDNPCLNTDCEDSGVPPRYCYDNTCIDSLPGSCTNTNQQGCVDEVCNDIRKPSHQCTDGCDNYGDGCTDINCSNSDRDCTNSNSCANNNCTNSRNCIDQNQSSSCTDAGCNNQGETSQCIDDTDCHDNVCTNDNFCVNEYSCNDSSCSNSSYCANSPSSGCTDNNCSNTGQCDNLSKNDTAGCTDAMCP